jgi:hypothetical protein
MRTQVCPCNTDFIALGYLPRSRIDWSYSISISNFLINCYAFNNGCAIYIPIKISLSSISFLTLVFGPLISCLLGNSSPNRRWYLILVLICTFMMTKDKILPFCDNPGESGGHHAKWSKPRTEEILHITYMESK